MKVKGAQPSAYTKYQVFEDTLVLVVTHDAYRLSKYTKDDGSAKYQHFATFIPLEDGSSTAPNGTKVKFKAGELHKSFPDGAKIMRQIDEVGVPVLGRLVKGKPGPKGGRPWVLDTPTDNDYTRLESFKDLEDKVAQAEQEAQAFLDREKDSSDDTEDTETSKDESAGATAGPPWKK